MVYQTTRISGVRVGVRVGPVVPWYTRLPDYACSCYVRVGPVVPWCTKLRKDVYGPLRKDVRMSVVRVGPVVPSYTKLRKDVWCSLPT